MFFPNIYHHRKVADSVSRSCDICYKLTSNVLITPDKRDFFYVCAMHFEDSHFCTPWVDQEAIEACKKLEEQRMLEEVKKEYEEKQKRKNKKREEDKKDEKQDDEEEKDSEKDKSDDKKTGKDAKPDTEKSSVTPEKEETRVYELSRVFYQSRLDKKRQAEVARRNRQLMSDPNNWPSVPKGNPKA